MKEADLATKPGRAEYALWALLALALVTLIGFAVADRIGRRAAAPLPVFNKLPEFRFENRDGRQLGSAELAGKPYIADFMFTHCPGVCPVLSKRMSELAAKLPLERVNLVSFTVDPRNDNRETLAAYAEKLAAPPQWYFFTGSREDLFRLIREGFQLMVDDSQQAAEGDPIVHSNRFVLVDQEGRIRGYYNAFDPAALAQLPGDLESLLSLSR